MASGGQRRTRLERVAALELPPGRWERAWNSLRRGDVLLRLGVGLLTAVVLCGVICGWSSPFPYRTGQVLSHDVRARVPFDAVDRAATETARDVARRQTRAVYSLKPDPLAQFPILLTADVDEVLAADSYAELKQPIWNNFQPTEGTSISSEESPWRFERFRQAFSGFRHFTDLRPAVEECLAPYRQAGLLVTRPSMGSRSEILVRGSDGQRVVRVPDILMVPGCPLHESLRRTLANADLADPVFYWIRQRLSVTPVLMRDENETRKALEAAAAAVEDVVVGYAPGQQLVPSGVPLGEEDVALLRLEHDRAMALRPIGERLTRAAATTAMILCVFALVAIFLYRRESQLMLNVRRLAGILGLLVATVVLGRWAAADGWRAELIPVLLFGQIVAIAYRQELALFLSAVAALMLALALNHGLFTFLLLFGSTVAAVLHLGVIRTRSKLIYVGLATGLVAAVLTVMLAVLDNQPLQRPLWIEAGRNGLWAVAAGFIMTGLLPFIEHGFGVLTDLSLLELADVSHPLLQELVRRAPSTYNHSITVGSIAEAAATAIGARGLLARVGAYYHDIGKMLKPGYFIENQASSGNRHESLVPAMSTLVIIGHIKDGAELARQHGLPQPIIDFIDQHHGTTLVEYFFGRANEQKQADPNGGEVDESLYRYPGPKPQTREAGVLMLADSVESASRSLVDPAPARIESLVREVAERKLDDGQFDESGLTLRELRTIENTMIKSLVANYHGRVKYPEQKTA